MSKPTFVWCGNYREFAMFCREELGMGVNQANRFGFHYIRDEWTLRGNREVNVIIFDRYYVHPKAHEIQYEIGMMKKMGCLG